MYNNYEYINNTCDMQQYTDITKLIEQIHILVCIINNLTQIIFVECLLETQMQKSIFPAPQEEKVSCRYQTYKQKNKLKLAKFY